MVDYLGKTALRKPLFSSPRWDVPLNENWELIAAQLETLVTGYRWVSGLDLTQDGGLDFTVSAGFIKRTDEENIAGGSSSVVDGTTQYIYVASGGGITVSDTFDATAILPLYIVQSSGGNIVSVGDLRHKQVAGGGGGGGGLAWQTEQSVDFTAEDGKGYPMLNGCTMTLPAVPTDNMQIGWKDFDNNFNQTSCFIDPGTNPIENLGANVMELNTRGQGGTLVWITDRWLITDVTEMTKEEEEPQGIKRVQRIEGTIPLGSTITHTIDAVDMNKTFLAMNFMGTNATYCKLIDSVTVRLWTETVYNYGTPCPYSVEIVEFY